MPRSARKRTRPNPGMASEVLRSIFLLTMVALIGYVMYRYLAGDRGTMLQLTPLPSLTPAATETPLRGLAPATTLQPQPRSTERPPSRPEPQRPAPAQDTPRPPAHQPTMKVRLYYYNAVKDKQISEDIICSPEAVLPVERAIPTTETPIQDTIRLLLKGSLTEQEKASGFITEFPHPQFKLLGADLRDGTLTLKFTEVPGFTTGGSCRVGLLSAQIEKTAKQFPAVRTVRFVPESLFQP